MDRVKLPKGVTVNGQTKYFRDKEDTVDKLPDNEQSDFHSLKKTKLHGRAFKQERKPGKLQRVTETIIYSKEKIKEMEYQKYYDENKKDFSDAWKTGALLRCIIPALGINGKPKSGKDILAIFNAEERINKRTLSKFNHSSTSYHLSNSLVHYKALSLFIVREQSTLYYYHVTDIGLRLGSKLLYRFRNIAIPASYEKLRLALSEMRIAAKGRGISEKEFNDFIKVRHKQVQLLRRQGIKERFDKGDGLKEAVENMPLKPEQVKVAESIFKPITESQGADVNVPANESAGKVINNPNVALNESAGKAQDKEPLDQLAKDRRSLSEWDSKPETPIGQIKDKSGVDTYLQGNVPLTMDQLARAAKLLNDKDIPVNDRIVQTNEPELTDSDNNISSIDSQRSFSKISFNIKVWIIPVTGVIEIS